MNESLHTVSNDRARRFIEQALALLAIAGASFDIAGQVEHEREADRIETALAALMKVTR